MATIKANAHKDLESLLKAILAGTDTFDTSSWGRAVTPARAFSSFPVVDMVSSAVTLPADPSDGDWLYKRSFPQTFGKFLMDFQAAAQGSAQGREIDQLILTRTKLKPYCVLNVLFKDAAAVKTVTGKGNITGKAAGAVLTDADLFTYSGGATNADVTGVSATVPADVVWDNTAKTLTIADAPSGGVADITLSFTVGAGVTKAGTLVLKAVAAKP